VYSFKAFTSEKQPDSFKAKGFNERTFVIKCSPGCPEYDISEIINPAGDEDYVAQLDELVDMRKLLLVYRLLNHNKPIPNIDLNLKNRDKQLCKPLIRLFQSTKSVNEIKRSLSRLLKEKKERKAVTIEAILYDAVNSVTKEEAKKEQTFLDKDSVILEFKPIWDEFVNKIGGEISPKHPKSVETSEYGLIPQQSISSILRDRFGGEDARDNKTRKLRFSLSKLEKLGANYSSVDSIEIIEKPTKKTKTANDAGDAGDPAMEGDTERTREKDASKEPVIGSPPSTTA
jgi:hypothetical protein